MVQWCWINFLCRGVLLIRIGVEQGPVALAVGADWGFLDIFSLVNCISFLSPSHRETARYGLKQLSQRAVKVVICGKYKNLNKIITII